MPPPGFLPRYDTAGRRDPFPQSTFEVGCELLSRLQSEAPDASYADRQRMLTMLAALQRVIDTRLEHLENRSSVAHAAGVFSHVHRAVTEHGMPLRGAVYADIGCGAINPCGRMFVALLAGAQRAWCVDLDPPHDIADAAHVLGRLARAALVDPAALFGDFPVTANDVLANLAGFDVARLVHGDANGMPDSRLSLLQRPAAATGIPEASVDVTFSNSLLEHIEDIDAALAELARITKPGGFGLHAIDYADHTSYSVPTTHPLEFLTAPWGPSLVVGSNRLRRREFLDRFRSHGFDHVTDLWEHRVSITPELRERLSEPWRSMADAELEIRCAAHLLRKRV